MPELQVSTSARATWIWAPDEATARQVRRLTGGEQVQARDRGLSLVTNVDIGVDALDACQVLAEAGFTFSWHPSQSPLNRDDWLADMPGMPPGQGR